MGSVLATSPLFDSVEAVIPVPLHLKKERSRGYNQSAMLASGIADTLRVPILSGVLVRQQFADSQTRKKRMERFDNVSEAFVLKKPERIQGKHILLVDDVLTTGATLETCGNALLKAPDIKLSMATIAIAMH
ncbi:MAG: ComF family protein [Lewinellaceae bacterium]|nr:ComF family protein [Lewinellaceae bacterium]